MLKKLSVGYLVTLLILVSICQIVTFDGSISFSDGVVDDDSSYDGSKDSGGSGNDNTTCTHGNYYNEEAPSHDVRCGYCDKVVGKSSCGSYKHYNSVSTTHHSMNCGICGKEKVVPHNMGWANQGVNGHKLTCGSCDEEQGQVEGHQLSIVSKNSQNHTEKCNKCSYRITSEHTFRGGNCSSCGLCNHEVTFEAHQYDDAMHAYTCNCGTHEVLERHEFIQLPSGVKVCEPCNYAK